MLALPAAINANTAKEKATGAKLAGSSSQRRPQDILHLLLRRSQETPLLGPTRRKEGGAPSPKVLTEALTTMPAALRLGPLRRKNMSKRVKVVQEDQRKPPMEGLGLQTLIHSFYGSLPKPKIVCSSIG